MKLMTVMVSGCLAIGAAGVVQAGGGAPCHVLHNVPSAAQSRLGAPMAATERRALTRPHQPAQRRGDDHLRGHARHGRQSVRARSGPLMR